MASIFIEPKDKEDYTAVLERLERAVMVGQKLTDPSMKRIFSRKEMDANRADLIENCIVLCQVCRKKGGLSRLSQAVRMINMAMDYIGSGRKNGLQGTWSFNWHGVTGRLGRFMPVTLEIREIQLILSKRLMYGRRRSG